MDSSLLTFVTITEWNVYSEFHHSKYTTYLTTCFTTKCGDSRSGEVHLKIWWISIIDLVNFNSRFVRFMVFYVKCIKCKEKWNSEVQFMSRRGMGRKALGKGVKTAEYKQHWCWVYFWCVQAVSWMRWWHPWRILGVLRWLGGQFFYFQPILQLSQP